MTCTIQFRFAFLYLFAICPRVPLANSRTEKKPRSTVTLRKIAFWVVSLGTHRPNSFERKAPSYSEEGGQGESDEWVIFSLIVTDSTGIRTERASDQADRQTSLQHRRMLAGEARSLREGKTHSRGGLIARKQVFQRDPLSPRLISVDRPGESLATPNCFCERPHSLSLA